LIPDLTMSISGAYTNAEINDPAPFSGVAPGQPLLNVPKYTAAASFTYTHTLFDETVLTARLAEDFIGPQWDISFFRQQLPSYALTNVRLGLSRKQWSAMLFVNNLTDKLAIQTINDTDFSFNSPAFLRATVTQPRTYGLDLSYHMH
jgi:outer membrane receptor protein involved in Fe transport